MADLEKRKLMLCDMHVHSQSSHDSVARVADTAEACLKMGISAFAVTDHCDIHLCGELDVFSMIEGSLEETRETEALMGDRVKILKGVEIGEAIWDMAYTQRILDELSFDVVIGSVHGVRYDIFSQSYSTINFAEMPREHLDRYVDAYFCDLLEMVNVLDCDVVAHLTCPLRYMNGKYKLGIDITKNRPIIEKILDRIIERSLALELNTSGLGTEHNDIMPEEWILEEYKRRGGYLVTLGSDAHVPENVGKGFDRAIEVLRSLGFDSYYCYEGRKPVRIEI